MKTSLIETCVSSSIERYIKLKRALGRKFYTEYRVLERLNTFLADIDAAELTWTEFEQWSQAQSHLTPTTRRGRMQVVRNYCLYRRRTEPRCFVPDVNSFPALSEPVQPHIFSDTQIMQLLEAAAHLAVAPRSPLRPEVFRLAIVLLYCTGMRRGELVRLTLADYDPQEKTLLVRESKFHRSRYLPLAADVVRELDAYLATRRQRCLPMLADSPLLWHCDGQGRHYTGAGLWQGLHALFQAADVRKADGTAPRVHDLRFTFAVQTLLRWYRSGIDVQAKLPALSRYMGHVSVASTEYYLPWIPELALAASHQFCSHYGAFVQPLSNGGCAS
jgi:integrase